MRPGEPPPSRIGAPDLRTCAFGDLDAGVPGTAWAAVGDTNGAGLIGAVGAAPTTPTSIPLIEGSRPDEQWHLHAEGVDVVLSPAGDAVTLGFPEDGIDGFCQLCSVTGRLFVDGLERELDCLGQRGARSSSERGDVGSLREVTGWFGPDGGVALVSLRRRKAAGHDRDLVRAVLFEGGEPVEVAEPRLSTTYTTAGLPSRAGLELWLDAGPADEQTDDVDEGEARHFPHRVAGEAVGGSVRLATVSQHTHAVLFRWHMRGRDGAGCYLLSHPAAR